ncbi:MAG: hypothetical protein KBC50_02130 [Candidatus Pacebacteria bacterium]|nr:hypothetical protein [Candidatus Paceibacterota bacterium]
MQDIRRPYSRSRSDVPPTRTRKELEERVVDFEEHRYDDDYEEEEVIVEQPKRSFEDRRAARDLNSRDIYPRGREPMYRDIRTNYVHEGGNKQTLFFIGGISVLVVIIGLLTFVFNSATVTVVPKHEDIEDMSKVYTMSVNKDPGTIGYVLATSTLTKSKTLSVSETKVVESKASGKIVVYNNFDTEPQRLIKNTRFESTAGKVYRINQSIVVPGKRGTTPGSIEVTVYADEVGSGYNAAPTDFTIPGFKGTERYSGFFARSNGPLTGGASGNVSLVAGSDIDAAKDELALELSEAVKVSLKETKRDGYVALPGAIKISIADNEQALRTGETSTYSATVTGYLPLVENTELAGSLALTLREYNNEAVRLDYADTLTITPKDVSTIDTATPTEVLIEGDPRIVWITDEATLKTQLLGKSKKEFATVMSTVASVIKADITFSPLWLNRFPTDTAKINIEESLKKR